MVSLGGVECEAPKPPRNEAPKGPRGLGLGIGCPLFRGGDTALLGKELCPSSRNFCKIHVQFTHFEAVCELFSAVFKQQLEIVKIYQIKIIIIIYSK